MTHLIKDKYLVQLPEGASDVRVKFGRVYFKLLTNADYITIGGGAYSILFTRDTQTEEGWRGVVDYFNNGAFRDYKYPFFAPDNDSLPFELTPTLSSHSLLQSKGIEVGGNWVILIKK